jgi:predicted lipoprotein with Yx(FWY)xxD motif
VVNVNPAVHLVGGFLATVGLAAWGVHTAFGDAHGHPAGASAIPRVWPASPPPTGDPAGDDRTGNEHDTGGGTGATRDMAPEPATSTGDRTTALVGRTAPDLGAVVTDSDGFVLYRLDRDTAKPPASACAGACAATWQPVLTGTGGLAVRGVDPARVGTPHRAGGGDQVTLGGWPLYRYTGDRKPADSTGQATGGTWWLVAPHGAKNLAGTDPGTDPAGVDLAGVDLAGVDVTAAAGADAAAGAVPGPKPPPAHGGGAYRGHG